jgi:hypothetical protein
MANDLLPIDTDTVNDDEDRAKIDPCVLACTIVRLCERLDLSQVV